MLNMRSGQWGPPPDWQHSSGHQSDDYTSRAVMRDCALRLFAEHGSDAVTVRQIAAQAQVSPALILHHYGSKAGLREAVDTYVAGFMERLIDDADAAMASLAEGDAGSFAQAIAESLPPDSPVPDYMRRLILSADPAVTQIFTRWFAVSRRLFDAMVEGGLAVPSEDPDVRSAFLLICDLAVLLLRRPLAQALGFDPLTRAGILRWTQEVTDAYQHGIFAAQPSEEE